MQGAMGPTLLCAKREAVLGKLPLGEPGQLLKLANEI